MNVGEKNIYLRGSINGAQKGLIATFFPPEKYIKSNALIKK